MHEKNHCFYLYNHPINVYQWMAVFLVFGSMIYEIYEEASEQKISHEEVTKSQ